MFCYRYRLAPAHHFPVPYEDVYRVVKHFLQKGVLAQYSVDPGRIAVSGDSAGGNLAAAVSQQVQNLLLCSVISNFNDGEVTWDKANEPLHD